MPDIFISSARADRPQVTAIAAALEANGFDVWYDGFAAEADDLRAEMEDALAQARCILVVWSSAAVQNRWVIAEAEEGKHRGILVPVMVEAMGRDLPAGLRSRTAADLSRWRGGRNDPAWQGVLDQISRMVPKPGSPTLRDTARRGISSDTPAPGTSPSRGRAKLDLPSFSAPSRRSQKRGADRTAKSGDAPMPPASLYGTRSGSAAQARPRRPKRVDLSLIAGAVGFPIGLAAIVFATLSGLPDRQRAETATLTQTDRAADASEAPSTRADLAVETATRRGSSTAGANRRAGVTAPREGDVLLPPAPTSTMQQVAAGIPFALSSATGLKRTDGAGTVTVRRGPGPRHPALGVVTTQTSLTVTGEVEVGHWYKIPWESGNGTGPTEAYVYGTLVIHDGTDYVTGQTVRVRAGPGGEFDSLGTLARGTKLQPIGKASGVKWLRVDWEGGAGFVFASRLVDVE